MLQLATHPAELGERCVSCGDSSPDAVTFSGTPNYVAKALALVQGPKLMFPVRIITPVDGITLAIEVHACAECMHNVVLFIGPNGLA